MSEKTDDELREEVLKAEWKAILVLTDALKCPGVPIYVTLTAAYSIYRQMIDGIVAALIENEKRPG